MNEKRGLLDEHGNPSLPRESVLYGVDMSPLKSEGAARYPAMLDILDTEFGAINAVLYRLDDGAPADEGLREEVERARDAVIARRNNLRVDDTEEMDKICSGARERLDYWRSLAPLS